MKVAQKLKEPDVPRQVELAETAKHAQVGLEQREQTLGPILMHVPTCVFLLRVIHCVMLIACDQPVAAGRVRIELTAGLHGEVGSLLHRLDRKVPCRVDHDATLTAHPGDNGQPIFVIMASTGLTLLAAPTRAAAQRLLPTLLRLPLVAGSVVEVISFHRPLQLAVHLIRQSGIAQPPAPAIAGPDMDAHFPGDTPRRARPTQQKGSENPVGEGALAAIQEGAREVIEGALTVLLLTAVAFQSRLVVIRPPGTNVVALAARALQWPVFPSKCMDIRLAPKDRNGEEILTYFDVFTLLQT